MRMSRARNDIIVMMSSCVLACVELLYMQAIIYIAYQYDIMCTIGHNIHPDSCVGSSLKFRLGLLYSNQRAAFH